MGVKMDKVAITVAPLAQSYYDEVSSFPTPERLAQEIYECHQAGASVVHLHVIDGQGRATVDTTNFRQTVRLLRDRCDIIVQGSTGGVSDLTRDERSVSVEVPEVEMGSLNMGSCNVGEQAYINTPGDVEYWAEKMRRHQVIPEMTARRAASEIRALKKVGAGVAILFGAERTGLQNQDIALSNVVITVPLNPGMSSLNLAQAVLLVAYEWLQAGMDDPVEIVDPTIGRMPAKKQQMEVFFQHVEQELLVAGFFPNADMRDHMMEVIRGWLTRTKPTEREIRMLHGVLATLSGRRLGGKPAHVPGTKGGTGAKARKRRSQLPADAPEDA
mgnify:CR=1 FL=1